MQDDQAVADVPLAQGSLQCFQVVLFKAGSQEQGSTSHTHSSAVFLLQKLLLKVVLKAGVQQGEN